MGPAQFYISVAVGPAVTVIVVMVGVLLNNSRINQLENSVNRRIDDTRDLLRAEMAKGHSELLMKFAELDQRISNLDARLIRIESSLGMQQG